jgi:hypothetical protein
MSTQRRDGKLERRKEQARLFKINQRRKNDQTKKKAPAGDPPSKSTEGLEPITVNAGSPFSDSQNPKPITILKNECRCLRRGTNSQVPQPSLLKLKQTKN